MGGAVMRKILLILGVLLAGPALGQECTGRNLLAELTPSQRAEIDQAVAITRYHKGIFWTAQKGNAEIILIGTYHFADPRHDLTMSQFSDKIDTASTLLVESGPQEQAQLSQALKENPTLITDPSGPTLPERMSDHDWQQVSDAMAARGIPAFVTSKMRPWYVAMMMGMSPCMLEQARGDGGVRGLDQLLMDRATDRGIPIRALERWDTVFTLFSDMTPTEEVDMLRSAMPAAEHADDYATTLIDAYFSGDIWQIWEFGRIDAYASSGLSRAEVDQQMQLAGEKLMDARNLSWIAPLEAAANAAATDDSHVVAAFGALHLPGENGVLRLLEKDGWRIRELPSPHKAGG